MSIMTSGASYNMGKIMHAFAAVRSIIATMNNLWRGARE
jgi:hypothetical protein